MKNKKSIIIIVFIALVILATGIILLVLGNETPTNKKTPKAKEATLKIVDGDMSNAEETLIEQHIYENYRIKSLRIASQGPFYTVIFIVDNISEQTLEHNHLNLTFLDSNKKHLSEIEIEIPELQPGATQVVSQVGASENAYKKAFDYKISKAKEATIPNKE